MRTKANHVRWLLCVLFLLAASCTAAAGRVIYVDADATGTNTGSNWEDAIDSLQDALLVAYFSDEPVEIRVAQGVYTPDRGVGIRPGDREASFQLLNGVTIKGGYVAGLGGGRGGAEVRDINQYKSILSGDLNADDGPGLNNIEENSYHVVTASGINSTAVLDGLTITGSGIAGGRTAPYNHSGGMYNDNSSPMLINCTFSENLAAESGAGMYNNSSNPVLLNCTFIENDAPEGGSGMYNDNSSPILTNCTFIWNRGGGGGAGMYNVNSNPMLADCTFSGNSIILNGGGMYNDSSNPALLNCVFTGNTAGGSGGGMYSDNSSPALTNCTFSRNSAEDGGGMESLNFSRPTLLNCTFSSNLATNAGGGINGFSHDGSSVRPTLVNCILWGSTPEQIWGSASVSYSNVEGGWPGEGNISAAPDFADPNNGDYHLKSQAGRWDPNSESWVIDRTSSPCIDAGDPNDRVGLERYRNAGRISMGDPSDPVGLERFPNGGRINMGAYGGTREASLSPGQLSYLPGQASNPSPADGAVEVGRNVILSWTAGLGAVSHDVYFGTDDPPALVGSQTTTEFDPGTLNRDTTYFWRIDEIDSEGHKTTGAVWTFTTTSVAPPKGRTCFTGETGVWVDGALVPISKVGPGRNVACIDSAGVSSSSIRPLGRVERLQEHEGTFTCYDVLLESGNRISVAENHYFLTESGRWVSLHKLTTQTRLRTLKGSIGIMTITKRPIPYVGKVFNLKVDGSDRYLVGKDAIVVRDH
jgi:hypothetical protein